ncbi:MAG: hypothetical protein N3E52_03600 [Candidatus Bathyarchaeota archaeon]|nr:hypothetical protein [Candidatus Bathyarchaeota archaeon]
MSSLACFSSQFESLTQEFGLQEKLFVSLFQDKHLAHGIVSSLSIFIDI